MKKELIKLRQAVNLRLATAKKLKLKTFYNYLMLIHDDVKSIEQKLKDFKEIKDENLSQIFK